MRGLMIAVFVLLGFLSPILYLIHQMDVKATTAARTHTHIVR